jgi:hypothetical protein
MDKFRIRGGDFIGIVIPGTILLFKFYLLFYGKYKKPIVPLTVADNVILFLVFIVLSYTIGIVLRLLSPNNPDKLSTILRIVVLRIKNWKNKNYKPHYGWHDKFPYFHWFIEEERHHMPEISHVFDKFAEREDIKNEIAELYGEKNGTKSPSSFKMNYKDFMNYCKLFVMHNSVSLGEEVLFAEGLSRMICGIFYSSSLSILLDIIAVLTGKGSSFPNFYLLFITNLVLCAIVIWGTRQIRVKEATIIFSSYGLLINQAENEKKEKSPQPKKD